MLAHYIGSAAKVSQLPTIRVTATSCGVYDAVLLVPDGGRTAGTPCAPRHRKRPSIIGYLPIDATLLERLDVASSPKVETTTKPHHIAPRVVTQFTSLTKPQIATLRITRLTITQKTK